MEKASTADMVKDAIETLRERGGSSLHNIKKYIEAVYKVDMRYRAPHIRKFLRTAVSAGGVVQTRGKGASGSFTLPMRHPVSAGKRDYPGPASKASSKSNKGKHRAGGRARQAPVSGRAKVGSSSSTPPKTSISSVKPLTSTSSVASSTASERDERARIRASKR